jgi:alpha-methylacyl-CoA racemase
MSDAFAPFTGLRVLDLSRLLPGPWASAVLADHGATVVKVEEPNRGDYSRYNAPFVAGESVYFQAVNRQKLGLRLDLKTADGREAFLGLAAQADVVIEAFRPGVLTGLGLGYDVLSAVNPQLILCSLTGFGQDGPLFEAAGHDLNVAGMAGMLKFEDGRPVVPAIQMADFAGASNLLLSIFAALYERDRVGHGSWLDVAMLDSLLSWSLIRHSAALARFAGSEDPSQIEAFGGNPRYNVYECADGRWVSVSLLERKFWEAFCETMGRPDLVDPEESDADRLSSHGEAGDVYRSFLVETFRARSRDAWVEQLQARGLPCFPVYEPEEVWRDPHVEHRGMLQRLVPATGAGPEPRSSQLRSVASPVRPWPGHERPSEVPAFREIEVDQALEAFASARSTAHHSSRQEG